MAVKGGKFNDEDDGPGAKFWVLIGEYRAKLVGGLGLGLESKELMKKFVVLTGSGRRFGRAMAAEDSSSCSFSNGFLTKLISAS